MSISTTETLEVKIIVTADTHVHPFRLCSRDGGKDRLRDGLSALHQSLDMARSHGCPWVRRCRD